MTAPSYIRSRSASQYDGPFEQHPHIASTPLFPVDKPSGPTLLMGTHCKCSQYHLVCTTLALLPGFAGAAGGLKIRFLFTPHLGGGVSIFELEKHIIRIDSNDSGIVALAIE